MAIFRCYLIKFDLPINESNCVIVEGAWGDVRKYGHLRPAAACDDPRNRNRNLSQGSEGTVQLSVGGRGDNKTVFSVFKTYARWNSLLSVF